MRFKVLPVTSFEDATLDFEQLQSRDILDRTAENMLEAPSVVMTAQTRVVGTAYQPSTKRPTFVICTIQDNVPANATTSAAVLCDASNPPTTQIALASLTNANAAQVLVNVPVSFICPAGFFYKISAAVGTPSIISVYEHTL